ncbi:MAG: exosortase/archaeosortase family protein [Verrucomicrobiae bacterium]|nr:exosortase/archaeosortase family protein [Verrucomicrobiae bacterium]
MAMGTESAAASTGADAGGASGALGRPGVGRAWALGLGLLGLWVWAVAGCVDEWRDNPMYSYGWFVTPLIVFFLWRRLDEPMVGRELWGAPRWPARPSAIGLGVALVALLALPVELLRNELPDDRLNNWGLALAAVGATLWAGRCLGGWPLVRTLAFPVLFFLTAVAWPKRYETPVTIGLQQMVATVIVEVLHVLGIHAQPQGTTILMREGPVGIAEACSGIRSLQASLMISLAVGELFFLRWGRRLMLIVLCAALAMVLNLGRTLALCLVMETRGVEAMDRFHDGIGDAILVGLPLLAWVLGRVLTAGEGAVPTEPPRRKGAGGELPAWRRLAGRVRDFEWRRMPSFAPALGIGMAGVVAYHAWLSVLDRRDPPQEGPYFAVRTGEETGTVEETMRSDIWAALAPTEGGMYTREEDGVWGGRVHLYHFFWKPAAANRWVTGHRPDICMPAGGWRVEGQVEPLEVRFGDRALTMHLFRFAGVGQRAVQVWGIWRNGEEIPMAFFDRPTLEWSLLTGKSRSAVEVVSCVVPYLDGEPPIETARRVLGEVMDYRRAPVAGGPQTPAL